MRYRVILSMFTVFLLAGCVGNESSLFVREMKVPPSMPDCTSSPSDAFTPLGLLDLAFGNAYSSYFLLENRLMSREDYSKPSSETAGIFVEGSEVSVRAADGTPLGLPEYYEFEGYIAPESEGIIFANVIPSTTGMLIAQQLGCPQIGLLPFGTSAYYTLVYADVKFLGHTTGGTDVETPSFTVGIELCCGCLVNWNSCETGCGRFCEDVEASGMCINGVGNGGDPYDCREIYHDSNATWQETEMNASDELETVTKSCDDCS